MNVGSLFSGIGGFDLGLERAGMRVAWQCESDEFCRRVLAHHWPDVPCHPDVCQLTAGAVEPVDVLCGGFPCQDISLAGRGAGIVGDRSRLWFEFARLVRELRPRYVIVENVPALLGRGLGVVLGDLAACGYDAEWDCLPASAFGAPHRRDRVWIVAYPDGAGLERHRPKHELREDRREIAAGGCRGATSPRDLADAAGSRRQIRPGLCTQGSAPVGRRRSGDAGWWSVEPDVGRVADGIPDRVDRLRSLGNALVPQIAEWIGRRLMCA